jgi:hypothetical protein
MATWIRNIPETWANMDGWRTDISLSNLRFGYEIAEYILQDGTRIRIPMSEMRRALTTANVRQNLMVGPFNVNPFNRTVNDLAVSMEVIHFTPGLHGKR